MGTIGSTLAPYIIYFSEKMKINSWILPGVIGIACAISILKLHETLGRPLEDEIEEER